MILGCLIIYLITGFFLGILIGAMCVSGITDDKWGVPIGILVFILCIIAGGYYGVTSTVVNEEIKIYSIGDSMSVEGAFVLGCGSIDGYPVFLFYKDSGSGGYVLGHVSASDSVIYEDAQGDTGIIKYSYPSCAVPDNFEIHVPKGTIKRQFNLDSS
jgi:hypothetical protein